MRTVVDAAEQATEVHAVASLDGASLEKSRALREVVASLNKKTEIVLLIDKRVLVGTECFLIGREHTVVEIVAQVAIDTEMDRREAVVVEIDLAVAIVERSGVERIAYSLSPVLPSCIDVVVVEVVTTADMVLPALRMVVIDRTALILCIEVFERHATHRPLVFRPVAGAEQPVFEIIEEVLALLLHVPFFALAIAVVVELEHRGVVFEEFIRIDAEAPGVRVVVDA